MSRSGQIIQTSLAPRAVGTYSQGIQLGSVFYYSGQIGLDPKTQTLVSGVQEEIKQILSNIDGLLQSCDLTRDHIIKTTIFLTDLSYFEHVNAAYQDYFSPPFPARSCVQVTALPKGANVEIEVMASAE